MRAPWTNEDDALLRKLYAEGADHQKLKDELGRTISGIQQRARALGFKHAARMSPVERKALGSTSRGFTAERPPSVNRPIEKLFEEQAAIFQRKRERGDIKRQGVNIHIHDSGPFGILFFGDPHVGDDGCDIEQLAYYMELVRATDHVYGANIGDLSNNWVGTLKRLYAHQHTTDDEETALVEWLIGYIDWLFVTLGNHDKWGPIAEMVCRHHDVMTVSHGAIFKVHVGERVLKIDARHTHRGNSQYNASFAQVKQQYRGSDAHVIIGGHIHTGAYTLVRNGVSGRLGHCIRLGSFKKYDEYADQQGFSDDSVGPACLIVCDPSIAEDDPGFVTVWFNLEHGVRFLESLRERDGNCQVILDSSS